MILPAQMRPKILILPSLPLYFLTSLFILIPSIGSLLFILAAARINLFNAGLFKSSTVRNFTCRKSFPVPSSSFSGSGSDVPRKNPNVTWFFPTMKKHIGPFDSNAGILHGFTDSVLPLTAFFTSRRKPSATSISFDPFFST